MDSRNDIGWRTAEPFFFDPAREYPDLAKGGATLTPSFMNEAVINIFSWKDGRTTWMKEAPGKMMLFEGYCEREGRGTDGSVE